MADIPLIAAQWLKHFVHQNGALLNELNVTTLLKNVTLLFCELIIIFFISLLQVKIMFGVNEKPHPKELN